MEDSISLKKVKQWYDLLSPAAKIQFLEYVWAVDRHKLDYASMPESLRRFYDPSIKRPTHQEE